MINIKIPEVYTVEGGRTEEISDLNKFIDGFTQLCNKCGMHEIDVGGLGTAKFPTVLNFDDGTSIGITKLFEKIGFKIN